MKRRLALLLGGWLAFASTAQAMTIAPLTDGVERPLDTVRDGRPAILMFWRADCAPCIGELRAIESYRRAAGLVPLLAIGLQPAPVLIDRLTGLGLPPADFWRTTDDAARLLVTYGGAPPRLPLTVMLSADGRICRRRSGLIGPRLIREWIAGCAVRHTSIGKKIC